MTNSKQCTKCKQIKDLYNFSKRLKSKDKLSPVCKKCVKKYKKKYYQKNKGTVIKKWKQENNDKIKKHKKTWYNKYKDKSIKQYSKDNKEKIKKYHKEYGPNYEKKRRVKDIKFKLRMNVSCLIRGRLKKRLSSKKGKATFNFLPYTIDDLIKHLEQQFTKGMTWDNYGQWHIDHIKPDSLFHYKSVDDKEFQECWALKNLQPMWAEENIKKGNKYEE